LAAGDNGSDPFDPSTYQGPQISQTQYDRIMNYIESGKQEGAKVLTGGERYGKTGYFIEPVSFLFELDAVAPIMARV
jgi:aldehyde dehydrogenase (NAD+)